ncbi:TolC family protein [Sphingobium sp. GCM10012300]
MCLLPLTLASFARAGSAPDRAGVAAVSARAEGLHNAYTDPVVPFDAPEEPMQPDDDLAHAIADAYGGNPVLGQRRYALRATDDALGIALSQGRPSAEIQVSAGYQFTDPGRTTDSGRSLADRLNSPFIERNDLGGQLIVDQPVSTGGRASAGIAAARADILAGREALRGAEGDLLVRVITAYADVRRTQRTLRIREQTVSVLAATLDEVIARRDAGQLTRTDIAQAQTQFEAARAQLNAAEAEYQQSRAAFTALVGRAPGRLAPEPALPLLPASIDEAFDTAELFNPDMASAIAAERASRARIAEARADKNPTLSIRGTTEVAGRLSPIERHDQDLSFTARATLRIPLSSGGRVSSQIAQALDRNSADRLGIEGARREMVQSIILAWNQIVTARRNVAVQEAQLKAARVFYEGSFQEYREGLRSTFDVLYAQNGLRETEIALLITRRDQFVAEASLLRQLGQLEAGKMLTGTALHDPTPHLREVQRKGALPWDAAIRAVDKISMPGMSQQQIILPARAGAAPAMSPKSQDGPSDELITQDPTAPMPGTSGVPLSPLSVNHP